MTLCRDICGKPTNTTQPQTKRRLSFSLSQHPLPTGCPRKRDTQLRALFLPKPLPLSFCRLTGKLEEPQTRTGYWLHRICLGCRKWRLRLNAGPGHGLSETDDGQPLRRQHGVHDVCLGRTTKNLLKHDQTSHMFSTFMSELAKQSRFVLRH